MRSGHISERQGSNIEDSASHGLENKFVIPKWTLTPAEITHSLQISEEDVALLHKAHHNDVFSVLGPHHIRLNDKSYIVIRAWVKDAASIDLQLDENTDFIFSTGKPLVSCTRRAAWLFQAAFEVNDDLTNEKYQVLYKLSVTYENDKSKTAFIIRDSYMYSLLLPQFDLELFRSGSCWHVDSLLGAHFMTNHGTLGVRFAVWAPNAKYVSIVADFNQWDGRAHPMRYRHDFGVWELFIPSIPHVGHKYGFRIHTHAGHDMVKIDPYAQEMEVPPLHASVLSACDDAFKGVDTKYRWGDDEWMKKRTVAKPLETPMSIYEVHLGSWMRGANDRKLSFKELADRLVSHVKHLNMTHVEFLPISWHPFDGSWGYQCIGFYAPQAELGSADELKYLIDHLHQNDIGVLLDFVPAHFAKDDWGLYDYDGGALYEYSDPREGEHFGWGTRAFNFKRPEVRSFVLGAAYHWLRRYHIDGLRVDAVSSMLYKNYQREEGCWIPNEHGGDGNIEAMSLLKEMNSVIHSEFKGVITIAEESTAWPNVTSLNDKMNDSSLGFDLKWDLGWMNDSLSYLTCPPDKRSEKHFKLTFRGMYLANERWVLPLSHDEVVSGKGSLVDKCGFKDTPFFERLRALRALLGFQVGQPGRPLIFMGAEFAQGQEWRAKVSMDWHEAEEEPRKRQMHFVGDLFAMYKHEPALYAADDGGFMSFRWVECDSASNCLVAFIRSDRKKASNDILCIINFSGNCYYNYQFGLPYVGQWRVLLSSDDWKYGGSMVGKGKGSLVDAVCGGVYGWDASMKVDVPANSCLFIKAPENANWEQPAICGGH